MFDINYDYVKSRHENLLRINEEIRLKRALRGTKPSKRDYLFNLLGNQMIYLGRKLKEASHVGNEINLGEYSKEYS